MTDTKKKVKQIPVGYLQSIPESEVIIVIRYFARDVEFMKDITIKQAKILQKHLVGMGLAEPEPTQTDEERIELWGRYGLKVSIPEGRCDFSESLMLAAHEGVPYCVDEHSEHLREGSDRHIHHSINQRQMIIDCYHEKIKLVYDHCLSLGVGPVWVLAGGGAQAQAFFGYDQGYLATLYLDMNDVPRKTAAQLLKLQSRNHRLEPCFEKHEPLFKGLKIPGVKVRNFDRSPSPGD